MQKTPSVCLFFSGLLLLTHLAPAQFVAFNDHYSGPGTAPNTTAWNVYGTTGGAPGNSGPLKDITTGLDLSVILTITNVSAGGGTGASGPAAGTPAYNTFNGYIDWGSGSINHAIQIGSGAIVAHVFSGLNPAKRYSYKCTAVRGGGYTLRWTIFELADAVSFTSAHTAGVLTSAQYPGSIANNQAVVNTGQNDAAGDMAVWENIAPSAAGTFVVYSRQYFGPIPGGTAGDSYAYAEAAERLEEFNPIPTPASITTQPQNITRNEFQSATFTVVASGNPTPALQWYRVDSSGTNLILNATNYSLTLSNVSPSDDGAGFFVQAQNTVSNILYITNSSLALLTVIPDTTPPSLVSAASSITMTNVTVLFSETVTEATATNLPNYLITNYSTGVSLPISRATLSGNLSNVVLTTGLQSNGSTYVLVVSGIRDRSAAGNLIAPNRAFSFVAQSSFAMASIGGATPAGNWVPVANGFDFTGGGGDISASGTSDPGFQFAYQNRSGDFDVRVRVASFNTSDLWAKVGLMARALPIANNSMYAATLASPGMLGCFFQARTYTSGAAMSSGSYPVNYPYTWLRLQRTNTTNFVSYASTDGVSWTLLGSAVINMGDPVAIGFALSSHANGVSASTQLREFGDTVNPVTAPFWSNPWEPLGPSTRRTSLTFTEIMYKWGDSQDSTNRDFVELYNSNPYYEDIGGYRISGDIDYTFPSNTVIQGGAFLVIARNPDYIKSVYGINNVMGPFTNGLGTSGTIRLRNQKDAIYLEVKYSDKAPWPVGANGTGHSIVLARPSYGEGNPQSWDLSGTIGGSPGKADAYPGGSLRSVVINEFLAHSDSPNWIELYNHSSQPVDLTGCMLSDKASTNKCILPTNSIISANGFMVIYESDLNFSLDPGGETIYFRSPASNVLDAVHYKGQAKDVSFGRFPDGANDWYPLATASPGDRNTAIRIDDIVINEIMYAPVSGDDNDAYVELYNQGTTTNYLAGWKFVDGISFTFPTNAVLAPGRYLVVAKNAAQLMGKYAGQLTSANTLSNFSGNLSGKGERLALARPEAIMKTNSYGIVSTNWIEVVVDEVTYGQGGNWPKWAHDGGSSLELINPRSNHRLAHNWAGSTVDPNSVQWTTIEYVGPQVYGSDSPTWIEFQASGEGEYLVDEVEVIDGTGAILSGDASNFDATPGGWVFRGNHVRTTWESTGGNGGTGCLHVRASSHGDTMCNRVLVTLPRTPSGNVTMRAKVKWVCGWPEAMLRLKGNWAEATGRLTVPNALGTPGQANSQAATNAAPAIYQVTHTPVIPNTGDPIVVTARAHDLDAFSMVLNWRLDPATNYTSVAFADDGTGGDVIANDGIYTAVIPGQSAGTLIAYQVVATDLFGAVRTFPVQLPGYWHPSECLIRCGDPIILGSFGTYRQWLTQSNINDWVNRPSLSNEQIPETFVYGNFRAIHGAVSKWAASPYHQYSGSPVTVNAHYSIDLPPDDEMLGTGNFNKIHAPGNGAGDDNTCLREQTSYWFARQLGIPWNYRRFVFMVVNGNTTHGGPNSGTIRIMEDSEVAGNDVISSRWPDDADGNLFKNQPWFEQPDGNNQTDGGAVNRLWCTLNHYIYTNGGVVSERLCKYRQNWYPRDGQGLEADWYTNVYALVAAASINYTNDYFATFNKTFEDLVDVDQWVRTFAVEHAVGNWDSFGNQNSQNMYSYKPVNGKWGLLIWDLNIVLGNSGSWGPTYITTPGAATASLFTYQAGQDLNMGKVYVHNPKWRRAYWRALKELCNYAMVNANCDPMMDARYNALVANGVNATAPSSALKTWISNARTSILGLLAGEDAASFAMTATNLVSSNGWITLSGVAPVEIKSILFNGMEYSTLLWTNARSWILTLPLNTASNFYNVSCTDAYGNVVPNASATVIVTNNAFVVAPQGLVMISEIMYHPQSTNASYIELFNSSSNVTFDISGWRINGLGNYIFPGGSYLTNGQYLVLAKDRGEFARAYGAVPVFDTFEGRLDTDGETLTLFTASNDTVDKVRYEAVRPWPQAPASIGSSLQLIDSTQDNSRVANWSGGAEWRYFSVSASVPLLPSDKSLYIFPKDAPCDVYLDDIRLVFGTNAAAGTNLLRDADFESGISTNWNLLGGASYIYVTNNVSHSGNYSIRLSGPAFSPAGNPTFCGISQGALGLVAGTNYTLSYWFLPNFRGSNLVSQFGNFQGKFKGTNNNLFALPNSPGAPNTVAATMPPIPPLWLNEVQPVNFGSISNRFGEYTPWVELYNSGTNQLDLTGMYLANNYTNLLQWAFPTGSVINPGEFKLVWLDGADSNSIPEELHANFTVSGSTGSVVLLRIYNSMPQVVDYLNFSGLPAGLSYGAFPDGQPFAHQIFYTVTPQGTNNPTHKPLFINELVAQNVGMGDGIPGFPDPADGDYDDWFEIFNPNSVDVDLSFYYLTDNTNNPTQFRVPSGFFVPANGYRIVWADGETVQNDPVLQRLHASFQLSKNGEQIAIYDRQTNLVDLVIFGPQTNNISFGRWGDGSANLIYMPSFTPGAPNIWFENLPPALDPVADQVADVGQILWVTNHATDPNGSLQLLSYKLDINYPAGASINPDSGLFRWMPTEPGTYTISVWVEDNGLPRLSATNSFHVVVNGSGNTAPIIAPIPDQIVTQGETMSFAIPASDTDLPPQILSYYILSGAPDGATLDANTGQFVWTPRADQVPSTNMVTVQVIDNGIPPLSVTGTFTAIAQASSVSQPRLAISYATDSVLVSWPTSPDYILQFAPAVGGATNWSGYSGTLTTNNGTVSISWPATNTTFFRLQKP